MDKPRVLSWCIAALIRAVGLTLRFRVEDRAGILESPPDNALIWVFWHNRVFTMPVVYRKFLRGRHGVVLTSPSRDGELIARTMARFGVGAVRGSSSRKGASALKGLADRLGRGEDVVFTPDGPRGPRYHLQPGPVKLAQITGAPVFPVHLRYARAWTLKTWDGFRIPWPFSRVDVVLGRYEDVAPGGPEVLESERARLEGLLVAGTGEPIPSSQNTLPS